MTFDTYRPIVPLLRRALEESESSHVIDLCSGAGGPWLQLARDFETGQTYKTSVLLTDLHPNTEGFKRASSSSNRSVSTEHSVSAMRVPPHLDGFRTIFSSFHHFSPKEASRILCDAAKEQQGIAIFEGANRDINTVLAICFFLPLAALFITPAIRSFSDGHESSGLMLYRWFRSCSGSMVLCRVSAPIHKMNYCRCRERCKQRTITGK